MYHTCSFLRPLLLIGPCFRARTIISKSDPDQADPLIKTLNGSPLLSAKNRLLDVPPRPCAVSTCLSKFIHFTFSLYSVPHCSAAVLQPGGLWWSSLSSRSSLRPPWLTLGKQPIFRVHRPPLSRSLLSGSVWQRSLVFCHHCSVVHIDVME